MSPRWLHQKLKSYYYYLYLKTSGFRQSANVLTVKWRYSFLLGFLILHAEYISCKIPFSIEDFQPFSSSREGIEEGKHRRHPGGGFFRPLFTDSLATHVINVSGLCLLGWRKTLREKNWCGRTRKKKSDSTMWHRRKKVIFLLRLPHQLKVESKGLLYCTHTLHPSGLKSTISLFTREWIGIRS